jgi:hypothetical protein
VELFEPRGAEELIGGSQRVLGLALAYEDLNDHDELRTDPLLATVMGKADPTGNDRRQERDRGKPLAGKSTLNRLDGGPSSRIDTARSGWIQRPWTASLSRCLCRLTNQPRLRSFWI